MESSILERRCGNVVFVYKGVEYTLTSHPYEPCMYLNRDGKIFRTLRNAFEVWDLPEYFAEGKTLTGINGKEYGLAEFCKVLESAVESDRSVMNFTDAAALKSIKN